MYKLSDSMGRAKIERGRALIACHRTSRPGPSIYARWLADPQAVEKWQQLQSRDKFKDRDWLIAHVGLEGRRGLFIGAFEIDGYDDDVGPDERDPLFNEPCVDCVRWRLKKSQAMEEDVERSVIDWGNYRAWCQPADVYDKEVVELRPAGSHSFPGVKDFYCNVSKVGDLPHAWKEELSRARGVYLLSHSGERYVGKADGKRGFWGRWDEYRATEHGGNKLLEDYLDRNRDADFEVTVLWEAPPSATADDILREEARWKRKMQSKKWGLNGN